MVIKINNKENEMIVLRLLIKISIVTKNYPSYFSLFLWSKFIIDAFIAGRDDWIRGTRRSSGRLNFTTVSIFILPISTCSIIVTTTRSFVTIVRTAFT